MVYTPGKWTPAILVRPRNHFMSSEYSKFRPEVPSFMTGKENFNYLITHEYARMWKANHDNVKRVPKPAPGVTIMTRKGVIRGLLLKKMKRTKPAPYKLQQFENIPGKLDSRRPQKKKPAEEDKAQSERQGDAPVRASMGATSKGERVCAETCDRNYEEEDQVKEKLNSLDYYEGPFVVVPDSCCPKCPT